MDVRKESVNESTAALELSNYSIHKYHYKHEPLQPSQVLPDIKALNSSSNILVFHSAGGNGGAGVGHHSGASGVTLTDFQSFASFDSQDSLDEQGIIDVIGVKNGVPMNSILSMHGGSTPLLNNTSSSGDGSSDLQASLHTQAMVSIYSTPMERSSLVVPPGVIAVTPAPLPTPVNLLPNHRSSGGGIGGAAVEEDDNISFASASSSLSSSSSMSSVPTVVSLGSISSYTPAAQQTSTNQQQQQRSPSPEPDSSRPSFLRPRNQVKVIPYNKNLAKVAPAPVSPKKAAAAVVVAAEVVTSSSKSSPNRTTRRSNSGGNGPPPPAKSIASKLASMLNFHSRKNKKSNKVQPL
jgi:hypothetical protein